MGTSEAAANAAESNGEQNKQQGNQQGNQGEQGRQSNQNTGANRPRSQWTEDDWNTEVNRIVAKETAAAVDKALRDKQKELDDAAAEARGEHERLLGEAREENKNLKTELNLLRAKDSITAAAREVKALEPDAVFAMVSSKIEFNADGSAKNAKELVEGLTKTYPRMFGQLTPSGRIAGAGERGANEQQSQGGFSGVIRDRWQRQQGGSPA